MNDATRRTLELLETSGRGLHALLARLTLREDAAEDLMQELAMRLMRSKSFARADNAWAYASRTAVRLALDWRRSRRRKPQPGTLENEPLADPTPPWLGLIQAEQIEQVLDAAAHLPPAVRDAFILRHVQEESYESIAAQFGKTPQQVRGLCHKGLARLRQWLVVEAPDKGPNPQEETHA